ILAAGWVVGRLVGLAFRKLTQSIGADSVFRKTALGRAIVKSGYTASTFCELLAKWIVYFAAILIALQSLAIPVVSRGVGSFLDFLPRIVAAIFILAIGLILSDWFGEFLKKEIPQEQREAFYLNTAANLSKIILYFVTITIALQELDVDVAILYIIAQALAWGIAIAIGIIVGVIVGWMLKDRIKTILS
ncbi:MAG: hypothetical protein M1368_04305, partial [Thaumarchaeota archaeon]|nr:hypothetical protein [Nitrososphaerota archaeon]